ncbi:hypothetical protein AB1I92_28950 [Bacillus mobilis]|uniref:Uncharacterized protein n=2 Tax=Bacillus cereus group TaxID=86661 RepID=A0A1C4FM99_BACCE|nr:MULTISPECIES: hypothetical protein [Bacillus cereus group]MCC2463030.1 hypothetical protein [Bacillus mobilis]MCU5436795.1 hypothetical protein [Bacillus mobilis]MCU5594790.1 hypothetical protein [Bacillus mobilis]MCU5739343.1 hypothetical protein [Bacillus mobilis]MCU9562322.1 hypothetical protein [Bacillus mobilis]
MKSVRGVMLAEDEVMIREYEASYIDNPKSEGYVIATNRRLIFTGSTSTTTGSSILVRDTKIDTITGIYGGLTRKKSIIQIIIGVLIALVSLYFLINEGGLVAFIALLLGAFMTYRGFNASGVQMYLYVLSSQTSPSISVSVEASRGLFSRINNHDAAMTVAASGPGRHTEQMIKEISALIQDIQIMGDLAVNKWNNHQMVDEPVQPKPSTNEQFSTVVATVKQTANKVKETAVTASEVVSEVSKKAKENKEEKLAAAQNTKACSCGTVCASDADFCTECGNKLDSKSEVIFG